MALMTPQASPLTRQAFLNGVEDFIALVNPGMALEWQVYDIGLQDIVGNAGIGGAKLAGWRFLTSDALGRAVAGDVTAKSAEAWLMTSLSQGPQLAGALQAAAALVAELPEVQPGSYEPRLLRIPGLLIEAFWLVSQTGGTDWVVPFVTRANQLQLHMPYSVTDFMNIIRPLALRRLTFDDSTTGAGS